MSLDLFSLNGRVVVVTGGMGQLGVQFTQAIRAAGGRVVILDVHVSAEAVAERFPDADDSWLMVEACDITSRSAIEAALVKIEDRWETPYGLVNNAALDSPPDAPLSENGPFEDFPETSWDKAMEVNAKGAFLLCQVFGGAMAKAGTGSIINVSSIYGVVSPNQSLYEYRRQRGETFYKPVAYSASKSALLNLTRYLATYWGDNGVRVNTLVLGGVFNNQEEAFLKEYTARAPMGRMADASEYNGGVLFLLSGASSYMTGSELVLDGGWTAW